MIISLFAVLIPLIAVVAVLAWKKKGLTELIAVLASTLAGFLIGLMIPSYLAVFFAQMGALIGLSLSVAVVFLARAVRRAGR